MAADADDPASLARAFVGAHGAFLAGACGRGPRRWPYSTSKMASAALTVMPGPGSTLSVVTTPSSMTMA